MSQDDLDHIPSIVPQRDGAPTGGARARSSASAGRGGAGWVARLFITVALVVAAVACAWAFQLQQQLQSADSKLADYASRIGDLEARLSDTDEGMAQSAQVQAVKIKELDQEVRKLWDNVWKQSKARLDKLEASSGKHSSSLKGLTGSVESVESQLQEAAADLAKLKGVAGDLSRLMSSAKANQAEVERVADTINRIDLELSKLSKRVQSNEEWVGSVNAFRQQVNASLLELQSTVRALQTAP